jgi:hypothetical protein
LNELDHESSAPFKSFLTGKYTLLAPTIGKAIENFMEISTQLKTKQPILNYAKVVSSCAAGNIFIFPKTLIE